MNPYMSSLCLLSCIEGKLASQLEIDFFVWMVVGCYNFLYGYLFLVWCILNVNAIFCFLCVDWNYDVSNWISYVFVLYRSAYVGDASFLFFMISLCLLSYTEGKLVKGESTHFHHHLGFNIGTQALLPRNFNLVTDENCVWAWLPGILNKIRRAGKDEKKVLILDNYFPLLVC